MAPKRKRGNHSPHFKTKVALEDSKEEQTTAQLEQRFDVHPNQNSAWKRQLREGTVDVFESAPKLADESAETLKELHAKIGQLTMEQDFLSRRFARYRQ